MALEGSDREQLLRELMRGMVVIIATWESPESTSFTIQDFIRDGMPFIPLFSSPAELEEQLKGTGFEKHGVTMETNFLASTLKGDETLVLNAGGPSPIEIHASELKKLIDPSRLPSG